MNLAKAALDVSVFAAKKSLQATVKTASALKAAIAIEKSFTTPSDLTTLNPDQKSIYDSLKANVLLASRKDTAAKAALKASNYSVVKATAAHKAAVASLNKIKPKA